MIKQTKQQDLELWDAWIEYDQEDPVYFGVLYVMGEIIVDKDHGQPFIKKNNFSENSSQLNLFIPPRKKVNRGCIKEVVYSEAITNLNQYSAISIFAGNDLIATLDDIEVLI